MTFEKDTNVLLNQEVSKKPMRGKVLESQLVLTELL